jgi:hypothetical protein
MKTLKSILALLLVSAFTFTSCKKDKNEVVVGPESELEGVWIGKYGSGNSDPVFYYRMELNENGTMRVTNDPNNIIKGSGKWKLKDDVFTGTYTYVENNIVYEYNVSAKYLSEKKQLVGSWGSGFENPDDGDFYLEKQ